jgi:hypothetical protein
VKKTIFFHSLSHIHSLHKTGDIDAMWLRDSTNQVWPYLQFMNKDDNLKSMLAGVLNRQSKSKREREREREREHHSKRSSSSSPLSFFLSFFL